MARGHIRQPVRHIRPKMARGHIRQQVRHILRQVQRIRPKMARGHILRQVRRIRPKMARGHILRQVRRIRLASKAMDWKTKMVIVQEVLLVLVQISVKKNSVHSKKKL